MEFFDSHSHYNDEKFDEIREQIIEDTYKSGVTKFICAGYDVQSSKKAIEITVPATKQQVNTRRPFSDKSSKYVSTVWSTEDPSKIPLQNIIKMMPNVPTKNMDFTVKNDNIFSFFCDKLRSRISNGHIT